VPQWSQHFIAGIAKAQHLYTRSSKSGESDDVERWFNDEYESPAQDAIEKVITDARITEEDWRHLVRYAAAQSVRTPAHFHELMVWAEKNLQNAMQGSMEQSVTRYLEAKQCGKTLDIQDVPHGELLPLRFSRDESPNSDHAVLRSEALIGRAYWMFAIRSMLSSSAQVLHFHKWTILKCPRDMKWVTSDNPFVKLRTGSRDENHLKAGWIEPNAQLFMPIGPRHLLYTIVGQRPPARGTQLTTHQAEYFQGAIVENAFRHIYASDQNSQVTLMRMRHEDADAFKRD
jgi:hypothetical protein